MMKINRKDNKSNRNQYLKLVQNAAQNRTLIVGMIAILTRIVIIIMTIIRMITTITVMGTIETTIMDIDEIATITITIS